MSQDGGKLRSESDSRTCQRRDLLLGSIGAAYGLLVLVFQKGYGADLLGIQQTPTVEAWTPIFLFCVLFGLSMDYQAFLMSRIREFYDRTGNKVKSVANGLQATAKIFTGAALIMALLEKHNWFFPTWLS